MKNIAFVTDIFPKSGLGNFKRLKELEKYFKKKKFKTSFFLFSDFKKNKKNFEILVFDLPYKDYKTELFNNTKGFIISLDHHQKFNCDINISIFKKSNYAKKNFVSLKYTIIRESFLKNKDFKKSNLLFISIGYKDILNQGKILKEKFSKYFKNIFLSAPSNDISKNRFSHKKKFLENMKKCSLGISNGGTTMLELIYLRKIVFVYPQNEKEEKFANFLRKKKYKIFIKPKKLSTNRIDQILKINQKKSLRKLDLNLTK